MQEFVWQTSAHSNTHHPQMTLLFCNLSFTLLISASTLGNHQSAFYFYQLVLIFQNFIQCNHMGCVLTCLASFSQYNCIEIHLGCICMCVCTSVCVYKERRKGKGAFQQSVHDPVQTRLLSKWLSTDVVIDQSE